jgi:hypothetical protein
LGLANGPVDVHLYVEGSAHPAVIVNTVQLELSRWIQLTSFLGYWRPRYQWQNREQRGEEMHCVFKRFKEESLWNFEYW